MLRTALRASRPVASVARSYSQIRSPASIRALHTTVRVSSGGPAPPQLYGTGGKPGEVPSNIEQATGLERLQLLGDLEGVNIFDDTPLDSSRIGTKAKPILVPSYDTERIVGCTGSPADSHEVQWFSLTQERQARCMECGSVYALDVQTTPLQHATIDASEEHEHAH